MLHSHYIANFLMEFHKFSSFLLRTYVLSWVTQSESDSWNKISIAKKSCNEYRTRSDQSFSNRRNSTNLLSYQIPRCNDREISPMQRADACIRYKLLRHQPNSFVRTSLFLALKFLLDQAPQELKHLLRLLLSSLSHPALLRHLEKRSGWKIIVNPLRNRSSYSPDFLSIVSKSCWHVFREVHLRHASRRWPAKRQL